MQIAEAVDFTMQARRQSIGGMGKEIVNYHQDQAGILPFRILFLMIIFLLATFCGIYGFWRMEKAYTQWGPAAAPAWGQPWLYLAAGLGSLFVILSLIFFSSSQKSLTIYQNGITILTGFRKMVFTWSEIAGISFAQERVAWLPWWRSYSAQIWFDHKRKFDLRKVVSTKSLPECVTRLKAQIYTLRESQNRYELLEGEKLFFGPLQLEKSGISRAKWPGNYQFLGWEKIYKIEIQNGDLLVNLTSGKTILYSVGKIPNLEIFLMLIREFQNL